MSRWRRLHTWCCAPVCMLSTVNVEATPLCTWDWLRQSSVRSLHVQVYLTTSIGGVVRSRLCMFGTVLATHAPILAHVLSLCSTFPQYTRPCRPGACVADKLEFSLTWAYPSSAIPPGQSVGERTAVGVGCRQIAHGATRRFKKARRATGYSDYVLPGALA